MTSTRTAKKKQKLQIGKTATLHVHHAFLYISLPSLHDYDVEVPKFTFCGGREHKTTTFLVILSRTSIKLLEFNSRKNCEHLTNWTKLKKRDEVWTETHMGFWFEVPRIPIFKWRFRSRSRRRRCCISSLMFVFKGAVSQCFVVLFHVCLIENYLDITGSLEIFLSLLERGLEKMRHCHAVFLEYVKIDSAGREGKHDLTRPQLSSCNARGGSRGWWEGKREEEAQ